jgi:hypothetical protein
MEIRAVAKTGAHCRSLREPLKGGLPTFYTGDPVANGAGSGRIRSRHWVRTPNR